MSRNYAIFLLTVSIVINVLLGYFLYYRFYVKVDDKNYLYNEIATKEKKIIDLNNSINLKDIVIDSLLSINTKIEIKNPQLREKIKISKNDEKNIHTRISNIDDATLIRELSNETFE
jgi:regulator of replication initiation timing